MLSIVIPTFQQRTRLLRALAALRQQADPGMPTEIVVVVDGGTDGTADAVRALDYPLPVQVLDQPRAGLAATRNHGAARASGDLLLFLDDDMVCDATFLRAVVDGFRGGADVVLTRLRLGPWVQPNPLSEEYTSWLTASQDELLAGRPSVHNIVFGATAVRRSWFERVGGFDEAFTAGGAYGAEDAELGHRLLAAGAVVRYQPEAVVDTDCETDPRRVLDRERDVGRNHVRLVRKHPDLLDAVLGAPYRHSRLHRLVGPVVRTMPVTARIASLLRSAAIGALERDASAGQPSRLWRFVRAVTYWEGVAAAGGRALARRALTNRRRSVLRRLGGGVRVLAYHAISDLDDDPALAEYAVTPEQLREHVETLERRGVTWLGFSDLVRILEGGPAPRRGVLLTFDDGYADNRPAVAELAARRIPCVLFPVSRYLGDTSSWIAEAKPQPLLDREQLCSLPKPFVEIGSHSRTHADLTALRAEALDGEVAGSRADLAVALGSPPRAFAYPYGRHDEQARTAVATAGYLAGFTVEPGVVRAGSEPFRLPRIEVHRQDRGGRFLAKVASAGRSPGWEAWAHRRLGWAKPAWRAVRTAIRTAR